MPPTTPPTIQILPGYQPGIPSRTLEMHMDFCAPPSPAQLAVALSPVLKRLDGVDEDPEDAAADNGADGKVKPLTHKRNQVWSAILKSQDEKEQRIVGVVYISGDYYRFGGSIKRRKEKKMLATSRELEAVRRLYGRGGFVVVVEEKSEEYVREDDGRKQIFERMEYVWRRDGGGGDGGDGTEEKKGADTGTEMVVG
ncbi:hypothetical protein B0H65DRAFT_553150 [Neurospora tetraspora]|uniref:Uncharacterized protein n=1 Tax=Neurospora tetraspora TaxID=94610 RepID=A0AAE0J0V6_9PEZI|nr:hypothetical protein B0H65DRAFT_553150 [Neurospora tetraspora]